jgi:DNA-binding beta-propeller fold protein YncE
MRFRRPPLSLLLILSLSSIVSGANLFAVKQKFTVGGEGGWDYVTYDASGPRLFITRGTHVMVVNPATGKQLADIPNTLGVHGVTLVPDLSKGFISAGRSNQVVVFDLVSLKETARIAVGDTPDAIAYEPISGRVFTFNARSQDATSIDAKTGNVVGTIPLRGKPEFAVANGQGHLFVNIETTAEIAEIDAKSLTVVRRWQMKGCEEPTGLAFDQADGVLFSGCSNKTLAVVNAKDGTIVTTLPIGDGVDGVAFDPELRLAFSSNGEGTLTVIGQQKDKWEVLQNVSTQRGARTLTLNPEAHEVYVVTATADQQPSAGSRSYVPGTFTIMVVGRQ